MPAGDGTGPAGMGPMTGRAAGLCAGYPVPGYMNPYMGGYPSLGFGRGRGFGWGAGFGRYIRTGWGRGFGFGRGWGRGRGRAWGYEYHPFHPYPAYSPYAYPGAYLPYGW